MSAKQLTWKHATLLLAWAATVTLISKGWFLLQERVCSVSAPLDLILAKLQGVPGWFLSPSSPETPRGQKGECQLWGYEEGEKSKAVRNGVLGFSLDQDNMHPEIKSAGASLSFMLESTFCCFCSSHFLSPPFRHLSLVSRPLNLTSRTFLDPRRSLSCWFAFPGV